jgi:hypothetical protein
MAAPSYAVSAELRKVTLPAPEPPAVGHERRSAPVLAMSGLPLIADAEAIVGDSRKGPQAEAMLWAAFRLQRDACPSVNLRGDRWLAPAWESQANTRRQLPGGQPGVLCLFDTPPLIEKCLARPGLVQFKRLGLVD